MSMPGIRKALAETGPVVEALERVGAAGDHNREEMTEAVKAGIRAAHESGRTGIFYPWISEERVGLADVITALDTGKYGRRKYPDTEVDHGLWLPGEEQGYALDGIDRFHRRRQGRRVPPHIRLAVERPDAEEAGLLHFIGATFDGHRALDGETRMVDAVEGERRAFDAANPDFNMVPLNAKGLAWAALIQRIKGEELALEGYAMRDATLDRIDGESIDGFELLRTVRDVRVMEGGGLKLSGSFGFSQSTYPMEGGAGLSVGPAEARAVQLPIPTI